MKSLLQITDDESREIMRLAGLDHRMALVVVRKPENESVIIRYEHDFRYWVSLSKKAGIFIRDERVQMRHVPFSIFKYLIERGYLAL